MIEVGKCYVFRGGSYGKTEMILVALTEEWSDYGHPRCTALVLDISDKHGFSEPGSIIHPIVQFLKPL